MRIIRLHAAALAAVLIVSGAAPAHADPSPAVSGLPIDRVWTPSDFPVAANLLRTLPVSDLPRLNADSRVILERISDPAALAMCRDRAIQVHDRMQVCLDTFQAILAIAGLYMDAADNGAPLADDTMRVGEALLHGAAMLAQLMEEFVPTIDRNDPYYAERMAGADQARQGLTTMISGATVMINERHIYSTPARTRFASVLAHVYPQVRSSLTEAARTEHDRALQQLARSHPDADVRAALAAAFGG